MQAHMKNCSFFRHVTTIPTKVLQTNETITDATCMIKLKSICISRSKACCLLCIFQ